MEAVAEEAVEEAVEGHEDEGRSGEEERDGVAVAEGGGEGGEEVGEAEGADHADVHACEEVEFGICEGELQAG